MRVFYFRKTTGRYYLPKVRGEAQKIEAGFFYGLGAASEAEIGWYDIDGKKYTDKNFKEKLEIISLVGNVAKMNDKIIIHSHGSFSDAKMATYSGHVKKIIVAGTGEIFLEKLNGKIERGYSEEIGLNLMK